MSLEKILETNDFGKIDLMYQITHSEGTLQKRSSMYPLTEFCPPLPLYALNNNMFTPPPPPPPPPQKKKKKKKTLNFFFFV
ncbi:MAG: hypothetical protein FWG98_03405 [Candidatus Cloacimonetes bacterium]|nr:hypothetical protein [Candidatus Cloacimonadota bacterium]